MKGILFAAADSAPYLEFIAALERVCGMKLSQATSGREALNEIAKNTIDLVVSEEKLPDMDAFELVKKMILINPIITAAVISDLPARAFHYKGEGLGILMQIPAHPGRQEAEKLIGKFETIRNFH
jgi:PleD family two-component response regulator